MKNKKLSSMRVKIVLLFIISMIVVCIFSFGFFAWRFVEVYRRQAFSHMSDMASLASENASGLAEQIDQLSVSVLTDQTVQDNLRYINREIQRGSEANLNLFYKNTSAISSQLRNSVFNISGVVSLRISTIDGLEFLIGTSNKEKLEFPFTREDIYEANGGALWGIAGERHYVCMSRAILDTNTMLPLGYMIIMCKNAYFSDCLATLPDTYSGRTYLLNDAGIIMAAGNMEMVGSQFPFTPQKLKEEVPDTIWDPDTEAQSYYFVGDTLNNGWVLVTTVNSETVMKGMHRNLLVMSLVMISALLLALLLADRLVERMFEPAQELIRRMRDFGHGNLDARVEVKGDDEIGQIGVGYNQMAKNIQNLMERVYSLELANKEAEIEALKMQINPHFLYNTLDTISWLGFTSGNEKISDLAVSLAKLLRSGIESDDIITVENELQMVQDYLSIQRYRFKDRFAVICDVDPEANACYMPNFLLQPLIENSIKHGLEPQLQRGSLVVRIRRKEWLYFSVEDDGAGMTEEQLELLMRQCQNMKSRSSIGLKNVCRRLQILYGKDCQFQIESQKNRGTKISFRIPVIMQKEDVNDSSAEL